MARKTVTMMDFFSAPLVVAARLPILFAESMNPDPRARHESSRMVTEKWAATQQGLIAAQLEVVSAAIDAGTRLMTGRPVTDTAHHLANRMVQASLRPASVRVRANARRLTRQR